MCSDRMLLQSFPQFARLPVELRCYVWHLALQQPRVHRLCIANSSERPIALQPTETLPRSTIATRTILATCQESRKETLRAVPDVLPLGDSMLHFNGSEDVICLVKVNVEVLEDVSKASAKHSATGLNNRSGRPTTETSSGMRWVEHITKLALEMRNTRFYNDIGFSIKGEMILDRVPKFMAIFPRLAWFFLVALPSPDLTTTTMCDRSSADTAGETNQDEFEYDHNNDGDDEEESQDSYVHSMNDDNACGLQGSNWIRGESGISDWYRWIPLCAAWDYANEVVEVHCSEVARCARGLQASLMPPNQLLNLSPMERKALESVRVQAMVHFREGVEPPSEL